MDEELGRFSEIEVFPCWIGEAFNKFEWLSLANTVIASTFFRPCFQQNQFPRVFVSHAPNWFQGVLIDRDAIVYCNHLKPAIIIGNENVLTSLGEILSDEEASVMGSGKQC